MGKEFQSIKLFAATIIIGVILFGGIALYLEKAGHVPMAGSLDPVISYAGIIIAAAFIALSFLLYKRRSDAAGDAGTTEKLNLYRAAVVLQYALLDAPAIFNVIAYLLSGNIQSLIIAGCCAAVMLAQFPTEEKYSRFGS
jgi:hypothetical protein